LTADKLLSLAVAYVGNAGRVERWATSTRRGRWGGCRCRRGIIIRCRRTTTESTASLSGLGGSSRARANAGRVSTAATTTVGVAEALPSNELAAVAVPDILGACRVKRWGGDSEGDEGEESNKRERPHF